MNKMVLNISRYGQNDGCVRLCATVVLSFLPLSVVPAIVVIAVGASDQYGRVTIKTADGASESMQVFPEPL